MEKVKQKSVILYGAGKTGEQSYAYLNIRYTIIGCSDSNENARNGSMAQKVTFIPPEQLASKQYDYILITSVYEQEIREYLIKQLAIPPQKILLRTEWSHIPFRTSMGKKNGDKTFYLISKPISTVIGIYSFLFAVLEQLCIVEENDYIPIIDMQNYPSQYLDEDKIGLENAWEYYYEQFTDYSLEEVYQSQKVILGYDTPLYKYDYDKKYPIERFKQLYKKYIKLKPNVQKIVNEKTRQLLNGDKCLGILYRGTDMNRLKLPHHPVQPSVQEVCQTALEYLQQHPFKKIYVSTEDASALQEIKRVLNNYQVVYTDQQRFGDTGSQWIADISFGRDKEKQIRGLEYIETIEVLSRCDCLLAGVNTAAICAIILNNNNYKDIIIIDKGEYGESK